MTMIIDGSLGLDFPDGSDQSTAFTGNAATITSGTLNVARLPSSGVNAASITVGTLPAAQLPSSGVNAASITTGTLAVANGGTGASTLTANNVLLGNGTSALQAVAPSTNGNVLTSNGTTWTSAAPPSSTPTTAQVLSATAGATTGAVGTYAWLGDAAAVQTVPGGTRAGSDLWYAGLSADISWSNQFPGGTIAQGGSYGGQPSGTWRAMGLSQPRDNNNRFPTTMWLRIS